MANTVKPPVSDHPKCRAWVVTYGRWSLKRVRPWWVKIIPRLNMVTADAVLSKSQFREKKSGSPH